MYVVLPLQLRRIAPRVDMWAGLSPVDGPLLALTVRGLASTSSLTGLSNPSSDFFFADGLQIKPPFILIYSALTGVTPGYSSTTLNAWRTIAIALGIDCWLSTSMNTPQSL